MALNSLQVITQWRWPRDYSRKPLLLHARSSKWFILAVVFFMTFTDIFLYGLVVPVIPRALQQRVGISHGEAQSWTSILLAVYGGALLICSPLFGYVSDHMNSRRLLLVLGLVSFAGATAMLCAGTTIGLFIAGRTLQGMSAAIVWTAGLALLADNVEKEELGQSLGFVSIAMSAGTCLGPLLGGLVYDYSGYYAVYGMAFALVGLDMILRLVLIEREDARRYITAADGGRESGTELQTTARRDVATGTASPEVDTNSGKYPPVIWLLGSRRLQIALFGTAVFGVMLTGFDAVLPLFVMETFGWSSTGSGLIFLCIFIPSLLGPSIGHLTDKQGPRLYAASGFLLALPFYVLLRLVTHPGIRQVVLLCALVALIGLCIALINTPIFAEIVHIINEKERQRPGIFGDSGATAQAYGLWNLAFAAGTIAGPLMAGYIRDHAGWGTMGWSIGVLSAVASVPVFLVTGGWVGARYQRRVD